MMPNALLKSGLASAIREFTDKIDDKIIKIDLYSEGLNERMDTNLETVLYRVIQECVNNVIKQPGPTILISLLLKIPMVSVPPLKIMVRDSIWRTAVSSMDLD
jgi:signal transduction histidine kinase